MEEILGWLCYEMGGIIQIDGVGLTIGEASQLVE